MKSTMIKDVMSKDLITVDSLTIVDKVKEIFDTNNIHHILVKSGADLLGIISKTDFFQITKLYKFSNPRNDEFNKKVYESLLASEIMTSNPITIDSNASLVDAALLFRKNNFHALPVLDQDKIVGIITTYDLIFEAYLTDTLPIGIID